MGPLCTQVPSTLSCPRHLRGAPRFLQLMAGTTGPQATTICRQTYPLSNKFSPTPGPAKEDRIMSPFTLTGTRPWATALWEGLPERMGPQLTLTCLALRRKAQANRLVRADRNQHPGATHLASSFLLALAGQYSRTVHSLTEPLPPWPNVGTALLGRSICVVPGTAQPHSPSQDKALRKSMSFPYLAPAQATPSS